MHQVHSLKQVILTPAHSIAISVLLIDQQSYCSDSHKLWRARGGHASFEGSCVCPGQSSIFADRNATLDKIVC